MAQQHSDGFFRGILQRNHPRKRSAGWLDEALNVAFVGGIPVSRPGIRPFSGAPFAGPLKGIGFHISAAGQRELLAAPDNLLQRCLEGGDPVTLPLTSLPTVDQTRQIPERVNFLSLSSGPNLTFIYDGINQNLKWDGVKLTKMGIATPPTPASPTTGAGLIEAGTRSYVMTFDSGTHESDPSPVDSPRVVVNNANESNTFASPTQGVDFDDPQVLTWKLYRTQAGGAAYRFIDEADIGVSITDNTPDETWSAGRPLQENVNTQPPGHATALAEHRAQLAGVFDDDENLVRFSYFDPDYMVPEGWPKDFVQPVAHGDGDHITALVSLYEMLIVFKEESTWAIIGDTFDQYSVVPVLAAGAGRHVGIGCFAPGSVLQVENAVMFASRDGIYRIDRFQTAVRGVEAVRLSGQIDSLYAAAKFSLGSATAFDRKKRVFVFFGHG